MAFADNRIMTLLSWDAFRQMAAGEEMSFCKVNLIMSMLVSNSIPFDVAFASGSRKEPPAIQLTIHINPAATLVFAIALAPNSDISSPNL